MSSELESVSGKCLAPRKKKLRNEPKKDECIAPLMRLVVVGGGIAGVCCAQELARLFSNDIITLVAAGDVLKESSSVMKITNSLEEISVFERRSEFFKIDNPNIRIIDASLLHINTCDSVLLLKNSQNVSVEVGYDRLCLCTGALPTPLLLPLGSTGSVAAPHSRLLVLRDLETVQTLGQKLSCARRVVVVGNGGIALELVHALRDIALNLVWVVREVYIGHAFFDATASAFIMPALKSRLQAAERMDSEITVASPSLSSDLDKESEVEGQSSSATGGGIGPEWLKKSDFIKQLEERRRKKRKKSDLECGVNGSEMENEDSSLQVESGQEVRAVREVCGGVVGAEGAANWQAARGMGELSAEERELAESLLCDHLRSSSSSVTPSAVGAPSLCPFPIYVLTTKNMIFGCDYVVSAIGATANTSYLDSPDKSTTTADANNTSRNPVKKIERAVGGEILVDEGMQSTCAGVFAAGDCCQVVSQQEHEQPERHWFQMKLWSQARSMGIYAAHCMARSVELAVEASLTAPPRLSSADWDMVYGNSLLDMFAHITHFFGHKVVLLGRFNAQGLGAHLEGCTKEVVITAEGLQTNDTSKKSSSSNFQLYSSFSSESQAVPGGGGDEDVCGETEQVSGKVTPPKDEEVGGVEIWTRVTPGVEYVKLTVVGGRVVGALLLGDTGLEEVMENLIMNAMDISAYGIHLLDPALDLEDFFD